ncbi:MAG: GNAT family N-acetyltransferase [Lachnospiraceae bacterium]|nr:GNAT family N-acetyltransferase [Lachnospiraceae bacterium]
MGNMASDIYFDDHYGKLYEKADNGTAIIFTYNSSYGEVKHQFIKRAIPVELLPGEEVLYDIVTPYGYGGPLITTFKEGSKDVLIEEFKEKFLEYCADEKIVAEFVRFHPMVENALDFESVYHPIWDRNTLGTNLRDYEEPVQSEFSKRCRKNIRQALNKGVSYRIVEKPDNLDEFKKVYYSTMERNEASDYYFFDDEYFSNCLKYFGEHILLIEVLFEDKVIAAGMYFLYNKIIHIHLSGTMTEYLYLSPAYVLRYALACWGKEHGFEMIHHGGGRSNAPDDSLFLFKKQFASNTKFDFYVGRKVWMPEKYAEICRYNGVDPEDKFFPAYRAKR